MQKDQPFYLVWNPRTGYTQHQHNTLGEAKTEAQRLARQNKGQEFIILSPVVKLQVADVIETVYDEIPF